MARIQDQIGLTEWQLAVVKERMKGKNLRQITAALAPASYESVKSAERTIRYKFGYETMKEMVQDFQRNGVPPVVKQNNADPQAVYLLSLREGDTVGGVVD